MKDKISDRIIEIRKLAGFSQEEFAKELDLSRNFINQVENKKKNFSDRTISYICEKIKINGESINEHWLRTGEGNKTIKRTRNQEITAFAKEVLKLPDENIKRRLIEALVKLDENDWLTIEKIANNLKEKPKS